MIIKHSGLRLVVVALIVVCTVVIDVTMQFYVEKSARTTARQMLVNVKSCVNDELLADGDGLPTHYVGIDNGKVEMALKTCARNSLTTPTGDVFAYDLQTLDFVFDPSLDCYVPKKKMTAESLCIIHKDPEACKRALKVINRGYDSVDGTNLSWQFDDAREYLEWVVLPSMNRGYGGELRGVDKPHQIVVVQGIEEDELMARYAPFRFVLYTVGFISILLNLLLSVYDEMQRTTMRRRSDDK